MPDVAVGVKHADSDAVPVVIVDDYSNPYDGLTSFAALEALNETQRTSSALQMVFANFEMLAHNIMRNEGLSVGQKSAALSALTTELDTHLAAAQEDPDSAYRAEFTDPAVDPGTFVTFRDASGAYRWTTVHTNKFRDKYGEILADSAHKAYVDWVNENPASLPVLRFWHIPEPTKAELHTFRTAGAVPEAALDLGRADLVFYDDNGFVGATGTFYPEALDAAQKLSEMKSLGCSHGFIYSARDKVDGVIGRYKSFEVSIVPRPYEANSLTLGSVEQEGTMLSPKQREAAVGLWGEAKVKSFEDATSQLKSIAETEGVDYKAVDEALAEPAAETAEPTLQEQIDAAVRRALAEQGALDRSETVVETGVINDDGTLTPDPAPAATTTPEGPTPVVNITGPITVTSTEPAEAPPADEGSEPVPVAEAMPVAAPAAAELPHDMRSAPDPMAGLIAAMEQVVANAMTPVNEAIAELRTGQRSLDERLANTEQSDDARIAARVAPRVGPIAAQPASTSPATELSPELTAAFRAAANDAETPPTAGEGNLVERYGILGSLKNAALMGGDAD